MRATDQIRYFGLNNLAIESDIRRIEDEFSVDLGRNREVASGAEEEVYYPQFPERIRTEAADMALQYQVFYCLENSIRELIGDVLRAAEKSEWWEKSVPEGVRKSADQNRKREKAAGVTPRSDADIDYINFAELAEIIAANRVHFGDIFTDVRAAEDVLARLNTLRAPIAHCKKLAEDEKLRLKLSLADWFRQMS